MSQQIQEPITVMTIILPAATTSCITTITTTTTTTCGAGFGLSCFIPGPPPATTQHQRPHHHRSISFLTWFRFYSSSSSNNRPPPLLSALSLSASTARTRTRTAAPLLSSTPSSCFPVADMDSGPGPSLFPLHRCKTLHVVRHAQGMHNVEGDKNYKAYMSPEYFDAQLTPLGWLQVDNLRKHVRACGLHKKVDLVITSPLLRTLQTAVGVFGGDGYTDRMDVLPLMVANAGDSGRAAISSLDSPPFLAVELCREHFGVHPCDKRHNVSDYQFLFPAIDFSPIETDEDTWWKANVRETTEELTARGLKFMKWLWTRKEKEIAIVTHSGFLFHTLNAFGNDCHPLMKKEISTRFANCELRSMVIVDRSMAGSDPSTTDYPGRIPSGLDRPSDAVEEEESKANSKSS